MDRLEDLACMRGKWAERAELIVAEFQAMAATDELLCCVSAWRLHTVMTVTMRMLEQVQKRHITEMEDARQEYSPSLYPMDDQAHLLPLLVPGVQGQFSSHG